MVKLALLWHMHQPDYEDLATGEHILPWVRLHAIKDYWGMVAMLEPFPDVRVSFNLVPSLVAQVQAFAEERARDHHLAMGLKPAAAMSRDEVAWLVANGFHAPHGRMIAPYPRYAELHARRHDPGGFDEQDVRDLQVWHKLAWMDPDRLAGDERLVALVARGRDFSERDKVVLRAIELELIRAVVPAYRAAAARGQVELATSPYYHPILPLLCDSDVHQRAHPGAPRPRVRFARPEDAREQIDRAMAFHERTFGRRPAGMWPSEGSVSDAALALIGQAGLAWAATDEDILSRSLGEPLPRDGEGHALRPDLLYRPYRSAAGPALLFRDHALSDRIGFAYQSWDAAAAAGDFVERVREAGRRYTSITGGVGTVTVILDGENAWEHFAGGGRPFLRALYGQLAAARDIETVTMSEAAAGALAELPSVFPGSWINGDFYIWMGHRDDQRAWTQLAEARQALDEAGPGVAAEARDRAYEELLVAEGSDWFWWYGDDHSSDHDRDFDDLFRRHVRNAYVALGRPVPDELFASNITTGTAAQEPEIVLAAMPAPVLDGRETHGLEWVGAVTLRVAGPAGAMHQVASLVDRVRAGASQDAVYLAIDGPAIADGLRQRTLSLQVVVEVPAIKVILVGPDDLAADQMTELRVRFANLDVSPGASVRFAIQVRDSSGQLQAAAPSTGAWSLQLPPRSWAV